MKTKLFFIAALLALLSSPALAWFPGQGGGSTPPPVGVCPYQGALATDGCLTNPGGQILLTNYLNDIRQSGQVAYKSAPGVTCANSHCADWNHAGIDYATGAINPDSLLTDIWVTQPPPCTKSTATNTLNCATQRWAANAQASGNTLTINSLTSGTVAINTYLNFNCDPNVTGAFCSTHPKITAGSGTSWTFDGAPITVAARAITGNVNVDFSHYKNIDHLISISGGGSVGGSDFHGQVGANTCRTNASPMNMGNGDQDWSSVTLDVQPICSGNANLYKTAYDPGLPTEANLTFTIASGKLTIISNTGTIYRGMYLDYAGKPYALQLYTSTDVPAFFGCVDSACVGHSFQVAAGPCPVFTGGGALCSTDTTINVASTTAGTTGPIYTTNQSSFGGAFGWSHVNLQYIASQNAYGIWITGTAGSFNMKWYLCEITVFYNQHANCEVQQSAPGVATTIPEYHLTYGVAATTSLSIGGQGTSLLTGFMTSPTANLNAGSGYQITYAGVLYGHSVLIGNNSIQSGVGTMGYLSRLLDQGSGPFHGLISNFTLDHVLFDATGASGACNIAAGLTVTTKTNSSNVDMLTGNSFSC